MDDVALNVELKSDKMKIFVTGKFGVGKSTFINGLFSGKVEAEIGVPSRETYEATLSMPVSRRLAGRIRHARPGAKLHVLLAMDRTKLQ